MPTVCQNSLNPREALALAGLIAIHDSYLVFDNDFWDKIRGYVSCRRNSIPIANEKEIEIPSEKIEIKVAVQSNPSTLRAIFERLQDVSWVAFFALLSQRPNHKVDGVGFTARGKNNYIRVEGNFFRVLDCQTTGLWYVFVLKPDANLSSHNAVLINAI